MPWLCSHVRQFTSKNIKLFGRWAAYPLTDTPSPFPKYLFSWAFGRISEGLQNEFELAMVNEPSLFKLLRFGCTFDPWPAASENVSSDMCPQRRFRSTCAFAQLIIGVIWIAKNVNSFFMRIIKTLIRLRWCAGWFESSFGAHDRSYMYVF